MREIKFRAWGCHEVTYNWEIEDEYGFPLATYSKPSMIYVGLINGLDEMHHNPSKLKFMQYTGLKDKNDVEIYEGDIVKDGSRLWKIEISPIYGIFFILSKGGHTRCYGDFASYLVDDFQVIGNIYEQSCLLDNNS